MSLRVAVQMDPLESINIAGDSSFHIMLAAQQRGHRLWHYDVKTLALDEGRLTAWAAPVKVQPVAGDHFDIEEHRKIDLGEEIDVVLMRQDPPFDLGYITGTHLLERLAVGQSPMGALTLVEGIVDQPGDYNRDGTVDEGCP